MMQHPLCSHNRMPLNIQANQIILDLYSGSNQGVTDDNVPAGTIIAPTMEPVHSLLIILENN